MSSPASSPATPCGRAGARVTVEVDGVSAHGRWMMLQASTYANGASDLRSARLEVDFALEDGRWRIARFCTEALFARPVDAWDTASVVPVPPAQEG
jgi:hypothetical protein